MKHDTFNCLNIERLHTIKNIALGGLSRSKNSDEHISNAEKCQIFRAVYTHYNNTLSVNYQKSKANNIVPKNYTKLQSIPRHNQH